MPSSHGQLYQCRRTSPLQDPAIGHRALENPQDSFVTVALAPMEEGNKQIAIFSCGGLVKYVVNWDILHRVPIYVTKC